MEKARRRRYACRTILTLNNQIRFSESRQDQPKADAPKVFGTEDSRATAQVLLLVRNSAARASEVRLIKIANQLKNSPLSGASPKVMTRWLLCTLRAVKRGKQSALRSQLKVYSTRRFAGWRESEHNLDAGLDAARSHHTALLEQGWSCNHVVSTSPAEVIKSC